MNYDAFVKPFGDGTVLISVADYEIVDPPFVSKEGIAATMGYASTLIPFTFRVSKQEERDKVKAFIDNLWEELHHKLVVRSLELFPGIQVIEESFEKSKQANMLFCEEIMRGEPPYGSYLLQTGKEIDLPETFIVLRLDHSVSRDIRRDVVNLLALSATEQWAKLPGKDHGRSSMIRKFKGSWEI